MAEIENRFFGRKKELREIQSFLAAKGPGFTHLRGRRRVGKTELLKKIRNKHANCFYFMGRNDEGNRETLKRFAREWDNFKQTRGLTRLKVSELNWDECFSYISSHLESALKNRPLVLLIDEIQWLSQKGVGFCGLLKEFWSEWKQYGNIKVIISGSSNRFFHQFTDGDLAILRGLRTHATIWVRPFSLAEVKKFYFPGWRDVEICLIYMMIGGIPYYLENVRPDKNFIRAVNASFFCKGTIFLEEIDAMLKLDTSTSGSRNRVKAILGSLGQDGATEANIAKKTGLTQDYVHKTLEKLLDYELVAEKRPLGTRKSNRGGVKYYMEDFYLNFFFQVLMPKEAAIKGNRSKLIFSDIISGSKAGYFIPNFTGMAFELLALHIIRAGCENESDRTQPIFRRLALAKGSFNAGTYWAAHKTQIDIIIEGVDDREIRVIEAKWISRAATLSRKYTEQVLGKETDYNCWKSMRRSNYLLTSKPVSSGVKAKAKSLDVGLLSLNDLF